MKKWFVLTCLLGFIYCSIPAYAVVCDPNTKGCNQDHHVGVYYMNQYEKHNNKEWKDPAGFPVGDPRSPYDSFYYAMKNGCYITGNPAHNAKCAHIYSLKRQSAKELYQGIYRSHYEGWPWNQSIDYVKPKNMIKNATSEEDPDKGWGNYDLVFFYGHNAHIKPTYPNSGFGHWTYSNGTWTYQTENWQNWGTSLLPYMYHVYSPITNAEPYPYMIFYTTDPFTSVLVGKDFNPNGFFYEDTWNQEIASYASLSLGYPDTKWIIAHGCSALPVATCSVNTCSTGVTPIANGKTAWSRYWHRVHIVLGHNSGINYLDEPDLVTVGSVNGFAQLLLSGEKIQKAYIHDHQMGGLKDGGWPTALSAEDDTSRIWVINPITGKWGWAYAPSLTMMENDTWLSPRSAIINPTWWQTRWKSNIAYSWNYYSMSSPSSPLIEPFELERSVLEEDSSTVIISLSNPSAIALVGETGIPVRQKNFYSERRDIPSLNYEVYDEVETRTMAGLVAEKLGFQERPEDFMNSYKFENEDASLSFSMGNNFWHYRMKNAPVVPMDVDVENLVNEALSYVYENDMLTLEANETLEILNVSGVYNAFYNGKSEVIEPYYVVGHREILDRPFVSEVEIVFGRKYHGIPVIGSKFIVRMGKDNLITGITKQWRDIDSSRTESLTLANAVDAYINSMFAPESLEKVFSHAQCGYFEDTAYATENQSTYICDFYYTNFESSLSGESRVRENLIPSIPVYGQGPPVAPVVLDDSVAE